MDTEITEVAFIDFRGSRVGMFSKIYCPVLETRCGGGEAIDYGVQGNESATGSSGSRRGSYDYMDAGGRAMQEQLPSTV